MEPRSFDLLARPLKFRPRGEVIVIRDEIDIGVEIGIARGDRAGQENGARVRVAHIRPRDLFGHYAEVDTFRCHDVASEELSCMPRTLMTGRMLGIIPLPIMSFVCALRRYSSMPLLHLPSLGK